MKYDYERIALWTIVIILVVAVFFQQRRSGFALQTGAETNRISMLDMMEYQPLPEAKRTMYKQMLSSNATALSQMSTNGMQYRMKLDQIMMYALNMPAPTPTPGTGTTVPPYLTTCTNAIVFDTCTSSTTCPTTLTPVMVGTLKFCKCPQTTPLMKPADTAGGPPVCVATCPINMTRRLTVTASGQSMCVASCPPSLAPGMTCV